MKVMDLVRMLERCPQNDLLIATDSRLGGDASIEDVMVGGRTNEGFTVLQLSADAWVNKIDELRSQRNEAENEACKNRGETTRLVDVKPVREIDPRMIECEKCGKRYRSFLRHEMRYCNWCGRKIMWGY